LSTLFGLNINFKMNAGVDPVAISTLLGWQPSVGSAMGFVGACWLEFQYAAPFFAFAVGFLYGRIWKLSRCSVSARGFYLLILALSVYLVMQDTDAWLYRVVLLGIPIWAALRVTRIRPADPSPNGNFPAIPAGSSVAGAARRPQPVFEETSNEVSPPTREVNSAFPHPDGTERTRS